MNYTKKSFSIVAPGGSKYADNWERTFGKCPTCKRTHAEYLDPNQIMECADAFHTDHVVLEWNGKIEVGEQWGDVIAISSEPPPGKCKEIRKDFMDDRYPNWEGPLPEELKDGVDGHLKAPVPAHRWPYGSPNMHELCCLLHQHGRYCDCKASANDEPDWGYSP